MYIGGTQKRPDAPYARPVISAKGQVIGQVGEGNRKDIRDAVEAAFKAFPGWGKRAAHNRAQIVYYLAENLELRRAEFAQRISDMTGTLLVRAPFKSLISFYCLYWNTYAKLSPLIRTVCQANYPTWTATEILLLGCSHCV